MRTAQHRSKRYEDVSSKRTIFQKEMPFSGLGFTVRARNLLILILSELGSIFFLREVVMPKASSQTTFCAALGLPKSERPFRAGFPFLDYD